MSVTADNVPSLKVGCDRQQEFYFAAASLAVIVAHPVVDGFDKWLADLQRYSADRAVGSLPVTPLAIRQD